MICFLNKILQAITYFKYSNKKVSDIFFNFQNVWQNSQVFNYLYTYLNLKKTFNLKKEQLQHVLFYFVLFPSTIGNKTIEGIELFFEITLLSLYDVSF